MRKNKKKMKKRKKNRKKSKMRKKKKMSYWEDAIFPIFFKTLMGKLWAV